MSEIDEREDQTYLCKFRQVLKKSDSKNLVHDLKQAKMVRNEGNFSFTTKLLAAKLLLKANSLDINGKLDFTLLAAIIETSPINRLVEIIRQWMKLYKHRSLGNSEDELMMYSSLMRVCFKNKSQLCELMTVDEMKQLRRYFLFSFLIMHETDHSQKLFIHGVNFIALTMTPEEQLFELCIYDLPAYFRGKYRVINILANTVSNKQINDHLKQLVDQIASQMHCQLVADAAADLICLLVKRMPTSSIVRNLLTAKLIDRKSSIRSNAFRWVGRLEVCIESHQMLNLVSEDIIRMFEIDENIWPPYSWETEDVSCIDAQWEWEEAEDVFWLKDRILQAYFHISTIINSKYRGLASTKNDQIPKLLLAGLKWHLPEIRLVAFKLWQSLHTVGNNDNIEEFIIRNGDCEHSELRRVVSIAAAKCNMVEANTLKWKEIEIRIRKKEEQSKKQNTSSYLPEDLVDGCIDPPAIDQIEVRLEELLHISGSYNNEICPTFPELYRNLKNINMDHRIYARAIIELFEMMKEHQDHNVDSYIWKICHAVTRCRLKAVVDHGCTTVEYLIFQKNGVIDKEFEWALYCLLSETTQSRTLAISHLLWVFCLHRYELFSRFWNSICNALANVSKLIPKVIERIMKTLKLFISKANCRIPEHLCDSLFWYCVDVQNHDYFTLRSSATILFGFLVRHMTKSRQVPLFYIITTRPAFWRELILRCGFLTTLSRRQRIILLSFLTHLSLGHEDCYSIHALDGINVIRANVLGILNMSTDLRERRFCMDILAALCTSHMREVIFQKLDTFVSSTIMDEADLRYFRYLFESPTNELVQQRLPTDMMVSPFVQLIERSVLSHESVGHFNTFMDSLKEIILMVSGVFPHSAELSLQAAAMALVRLVERHQNNWWSYPEKEMFVDLCIFIFSHTFCSSRVCSIMSRIPVVLKLTTSYMQDYYVIEYLRRWLIE